MGSSKSALKETPNSPKPKPYDFSFLITAVAHIEIADDSRYLRIGPDVVKLILRYLLEDLTVQENDRQLLPPDTVHSFNVITICESGALSTSEWNGEYGGTLKLKANKIHIRENGKIQVNGKGYRGGQKKKKETNGFAYQGESYNGKGTEHCAANDGGGGGGRGKSARGSSGGGGGGYGSKGSDAATSTSGLAGGVGGSVYGDSLLSTLHLGSGGGSGHPYTVRAGYEAGSGGGALEIVCKELVIEQNAAIEANGGDAEGMFMTPRYCVSGGGGGSGGSIYISAQSITNHGCILAVGGKGAPQGDNSGYGLDCTSGGNGGVGRIRIDYGNMQNSGRIQPHIGYTEKLSIDSK